MSRVVTVWTFIVVAVVLPRSVLAQESEAATIRRANALAAAGDHAAAVRMLRRAQLDTPSPRVDLNLALSFAELGRLRQARALLQRVITSDANPLLVDTAREQLRAVEAQLPTLTVRVDESASELQVDSRTFRVDGRVVRVHVDPGAHHLEVRRRDGTLIAEQDVELAAGERTVVSMRRARSAPPERSRGAVEPSLAAVTISATELDRPELEQPEELDRSEDVSRSAALDRPAEVAPAPRVLAAPSSERRPNASERDDSLLWIIAGAGAATAVLVVVLTAAIVAAQPGPTMGDVPPVWVGG